MNIQKHFINVINQVASVKFVFLTVISVKSMLMHITMITNSQP